MKIEIFGHPYAPIGIGEQMASFSRAMERVYIDHRIHDIYGSDSTLRASRQWLNRKETNNPNYGDIRIFHINGDDIEPCLKHLKQKGFRFENGKNIIIPAWELPRYPDTWIDSVNRFDEIWALSHFIEEVFNDERIKIPVRYVGQSAERSTGLHYPRKYFGIKESSLMFLSFFDLSSYPARKNPYASIEIYKELRKRHPYSDFQMVLKTKNIDKSSNMKFERVDENLIVIDENLNYDMTTSLIDSCDIFVSLHRSEGFGRGAAEAVMRGRIAMITDYSGVRDYSADSAVIPVPYSMVAVKEEEYPYGEGQMWAEPDINQAIDTASEMIERWERGYSTALFYEEHRDAGEIVRETVSDFAVGCNIINNLFGDEYNG